MAAFLIDYYFAIFKSCFQIANCQRAAKHHAFCGLRNIDKTATADGAVVELANVDVAGLVDLRGAHHGNIQSAAVMHVEHRQLIGARARV